MLTVISFVYANDVLMNCAIDKLNVTMKAARFSDEMVKPEISLF